MIASEYDNENNHIGYLSIRHDITAQKNYEQQRELLVEKQKMAALGEMIANIAHQWRQPLATITTSASASIYQKKMGILSDELFTTNMESINDSAQYLSQTIDTFRDYLKEKKEYKRVILQERVKKASDIILATLENNQIKLIDAIDYTHPIHISLVVGELSEVIINIINNAKDALVDKKIQSPWVKISLIKEYDKAIITIEDNAGGISEEVMPKIFEPYFTTKHESVGTGLWLHMSYKIVTESLGGTIYVKNMQNGAKFFIKIPLS
jgi:C4-dicarboxylate-specific signal transduction histidine kinase